jgi:DNA-binding transcriptional ArsR family regulator
MAQALPTLEDKAGEVAGLLSLIANERRLLMLCHISRAGEITVGRLGELVGLSQSALSQHLALMRERGVVATRRNGVSIHYRLTDARIEKLMASMMEIFCPPE